MYMNAYQGYKGKLRIDPSTMKVADNGLIPLKINYIGRRRKPINTRKCMKFKEKTISK